MIHFNIILLSHPGLPHDFSPSGSSTEMLNTFLTFPMRAVYSQITPLDVCSLEILGKVYTQIKH